MVGRDDYKFLEIKDAITSINQKVNLIGVILEFGFPKKSRGTDWFYKLKIIDESHTEPGISIHIFEEDVQKLPNVAVAGDIIQLSRVVMKTHAGEVYAVFNKKFSSFALYEGKDGKDFLPYQVSSKFRPRDLDKKFIAGLRDLLVDFKLDEGSDNLLLREIKEADGVKLICKVVHVCNLTKDGWVAFIWDGTDAPPINTKLEEEMDTVPSPLPLSRDVLRTFPRVGTVLRLIFDEGIEKHCLSMLSVGKWVKFINVVCEVQAGLWRVVLTSFSRLRYTPNDDHLVLGRQRLYEERALSNMGRMPLWSFPWPSPTTAIENDWLPFFTLMDVLTYKKVTAMYKCVVRVVSFYPSRPEDFRSPSGVYRIRLTLEDPTARIHAFVYGEDGERFFDGYPSIDILRRKRNNLLGITAASDDGKEIDDPPINPPWVQCCIKSYYLTKADIWGSRHYRIFGTKVAY